MADAGTYKQGATPQELLHAVLTDWTGCSVLKLGEHVITRSGPAKADAGRGHQRGQPVNPSQCCVFSGVVVQDWIEG